MDSRPRNLSGYSVGPRRARRGSRSVLAALGLVGLLLTSFPARTHGGTTVIRAGRLVDVAAGTVSEGVDIVVEGDRIARVGSGLTIPEGATVIDLSDRTELRLTGGASANSSAPVK